MDAGDVGSGAQLIGESRYAHEKPVQPLGKAGEYGFLKIRYKLPDGRKSRLIEQPMTIANGTGALPAALKDDVEFSTAVAGFAQLLKGGAFTGPLTFEDVIRQAQGSKGEDLYGYRTEFVQLVRKAQVAKGM